MANAGIVTQYGFLFQRKAFIFYVLSNVATNQSYTFEGKDDIDISTDESIFCVQTPGSDFIQVKSGTVDETCFCKVICNWLLLDKEACNPTLFIENELPFPVDDSIKDKILEYISNGKEKKKSSIARKAYEKYKDLIPDNLTSLSDRICELLDSYKQVVHGMDDLDRRLEEVFSSTYCQDIKEYELAKAKRLERFILYINREIDNSIKAKTPYILLYPNFIRIIMQVRDEISDEKYVTNIPELKKKVKDEAARIVGERAIREVEQLYFVDQSDQFVIDGIVHELLYKDFREVYVKQKELELANIEQDAHENYETALFSLEEEDRHIPKKVYQETVKIPIAGSLLPQSSVYRKGCYIYLTGNEIDEENQITWGEGNE